jgi:hypothetical protein
MDDGSSEGNTPDVFPAPVPQQMPAPVQLQVQVPAYQPPIDIAYLQNNYIHGNNNSFITVPNEHLLYDLEQPAEFLSHLLYTPYSMNTLDFQEQQQQQQQQPDQNSQDEKEEEEIYKKVMEQARKILLKICSAQETDGILTTMAKVRQLGRTYLMLRHGIVDNWYRFWKVDQFSQEIALILSQQIQIYEASTTPVLIWDRGGSVHYMNNSHRVLTNNFDPTPPKRLYFFHTEMSPFGYKTYLLSMLNFMVSIFCSKTNLSSTGFMFSTAIRVHPEDNKYLEGTMSVTAKMDAFGMPLLYIANFLPKYIQMPKLPTIS